ncbi:MAG: ribonuclease III [Lactobacillaceae bacterium]|jgi:ribonuclease-3|nr:ribonuclease III [Lactobacillaceae bacterium]
MSDVISGLKRDFDISFKDVHLLNEAFTHGTYLHENLHDKGRDYQRLEFLGDSVMQLMVADFLYRDFSNWNEGQLTEARISMVQSKSFSHFARLAHFDEYILLSKSSKKQKLNDNDNLLEDIFESFIAALYIDQGIPAVRKFLDKTLFKAFNEGYFNQFVNYKSKLQELVQQVGKVEIKYVVTNQDSINEEEPYYEVDVLINGIKNGSGSGRSIKEAEKIAAQNAYKELSDL